MSRQSRLPVRSNSSSSIQLRNSNACQRSKSLVRCMASLKTTPLSTKTGIKKRSPSVPKLSTNYLGVTPTLGQSSKRRSPFAPKPINTVRVTPTTCAVKKKSLNFPKDDQNWLKKTAADMKAIITCLDPNFEKENLMQISVEKFVIICNMLLYENSQFVKLNRQNYMQKLPAVLNLLDYPNTVAASILKCPNLKRNYPHIVSIWAHLHDTCFYQREQVVEFCSPISGKNEDKPEEKEDNTTEIMECGIENQLIEYRQLEEKICESKNIIEAEEAEIEESLQKLNFNYTELDKAANYEELIATANQTCKAKEEESQMIERELAEGNSIEECKKLITSWESELYTLEQESEALDHKLELAMGTNEAFMAKWTKCDEDIIKIHREIEGRIYMYNTLLITDVHLSKIRDMLRLPTEITIGIKAKLEKGHNTLEKLNNVLVKEYQDIVKTKVEYEAVRKELKKSIKVVSEEIHLLSQNKSEVEINRDKKFEFSETLDNRISVVISNINEYKKRYTILKSIKASNDEKVLQTHATIKAIQMNYTEISESLLKEELALSELLQQKCIETTCAYDEFKRTIKNNL